MVKCDVLRWTDQVTLFKEAVANSPTKRIDIVVVNAGIVGEDDIFATDGQSYHLSCLSHG
jgi:NAD(P)-dependent dehydrogenase (short-subunit alcohol dehydrogenase family)